MYNVQILHFFSFIVIKNIRDMSYEILVFFSSNKNSITLMKYRRILKIIFLKIYIELRVYRDSISGPVLLQKWEGRIFSFDSRAHFSFNQHYLTSGYVLLSCGLVFKRNVLKGVSVSYKIKYHRDYNNTFGFRRSEMKTLF